MVIKKEEEVMFVTELYCDEEKTLQQGIMYKYGDERERDFQRANVNIHLTKLVSTRYYDKDMKLISVILNKEGEE